MTTLDVAGNALAPNRDPLARSSMSCERPTAEVINGVLVAQCPNGIAYRMSPALDERCRFVAHGMVLAHSEADCEGLYREAKLWGVTGVRFAVG